jgi:integrase
MTARGSLVLKIRIRGCDPIRRLSGTYDPKILRKLKAMCHAVNEQGRGDLVNGIASGRLKPLDVYNKYRFNRLEDLPHADELPRYADIWPRMLAELDFSDDHRATLEGYFKRLGRLMPVDATLAAIVPALQEYRATHRTKPRSFEYAQNAAARLVKYALTRRHRLYMEVRDVEGMKRIKKRLPKPLSPAQLRDLMAKLEEPWRGMVWTLATTGMLPKAEYAGRWEREGVGLRIHGEKTEGRDRLIPLIGALYPCKGGDRALYLRMKKYGWIPKDLRTTYANLMVEAGVPRPRREQYMGHQPQDMTAVYERMEVERFLLEDAEKMRAVLGEPTFGLALVKA